MRLLTKIRDRMLGKTLKRDIRFDSGGFSVVPYKKPETRVLWSGVFEVFAFKQDLFSVDQICLGFRVDDAGRFVWVGEDDGGFRAFRAEVEMRFPSIDADWFGKVAQPPFQENRSTLWHRTSRKKARRTIHPHPS